VKNREVAYSIECFEKGGERFIKEFPLPKRLNYRVLFGKHPRTIPLDCIKIDKSRRVKLECRVGFHIPIERFECFFSEKVIR
jgi:hypothetical protein